MITLLSSDFVLPPVTNDDLVIASLAWGVTIGFGWLTTWTAIKQTWQFYKRNNGRILPNAYIWMIWLEILVCLTFSIICWLYLKGIIAPSFAFYFCIGTYVFSRFLRLHTNLLAATWALQVQFLLQIIVNRCGLLLMNTRKTLYLKIGVAILITIINIAVFAIWIPSRLQISEKYTWINERWDRCEKVIYLLVDASLNFYFIRTVDNNLVKNGLTKYKTLVNFNKCIVGLSLSMDILIISMMSLNNTFVYMQFHPFAYMVKLNIEMSMADLIGMVASEPHCGAISNFGVWGLEGHENVIASPILTSTQKMVKRSAQVIRTIYTPDIKIYKPSESYRGIQREEV